MHQYAKAGKRNLTLLGLALTLLFPIVLFSVACEPGGWLVVENQRNQDVTIDVITGH